MKITGKLLSTIMQLVIFFSFFSFFFQHKVLKYTKDVPDELKDTLDHESFEKARVYQLDRSSFGFVSGAYSQVETTVRYIHQFGLQSY